MDKMHTRAAEVLADIFQAMPKDPTLEELDVELDVAMSALQQVEIRANQMRPHGTTRLAMRPTGLLLQALTEQYYKCDAGDEVGA